MGQLQDGIDNGEAMVMVHGWSDLKPVIGVKIPRAPDCCLGMVENPAA